MELEGILFLFGFLLLTGLVVIIVLLLQNKNQQQDDQTTPILLNLLHDLRKELNEKGNQQQLHLQHRLDQMTQQLATHQQASVQHFLQQHRTNTAMVKDISQQLNNIRHTNHQILGFAEQMRQLEKILKNPKQRGVLGEYFLEALLDNALSPKQYKMQYRFKNGTIVDAVIYFRNQIIPIDAKFSLDKYNKIQQEDKPQIKQQLEKAFRNDLKQRIDETSKYVRPQENTTDFAFMFIPAEGIYHNLLTYNVGTAHQNGSGSDLIEYAFRKKVIIVSPSSFYAYLETVLQGLKALQIEESIKEVIKRVGELNKHLKNYETYMEKTGKHLQTALNMYAQAQQEFKKIDKDVWKITQEKPINTSTDKASTLFDEIEST